LQQVFDAENRQTREFAYNSDRRMQGSSVSGVSFSTGQPFDVGRVSDFDVAISHPELYHIQSYIRKQNN